MKLIWTKNKLPASWLIREGLDEPVSHFAIVFDDHLVYHSNFVGVHLVPYVDFAEKNDIVYAIEIEMSLEEEETVYQELIKLYRKRNYDFGAFAYFAWCVLKKKVAGIPLPKTNKWGSSNEYLCTEMYTVLPKKYRKVELPRDIQLVSPYELYKCISGS